MIQALFLVSSVNIEIGEWGGGLAVIKGKVGQFQVAFYLIEANTPVWLCWTHWNSPPEDGDVYEGRS